MKSSLIKNLFSYISPAGQKGKLSIFAFHRVPRSADPIAPNELCSNRFETILDFLFANMKVVPLSDASAMLAEGKLPSRAVALTFDDGYSDWFETVCPALLKRNLPATFFITTDQLTGQALWHERILAAVKALPDHGSSLPYGLGNYANLHQTRDRIQLANELQRRLKYASLEERSTIIDLLEAQATSKLILPDRFTAESVRTLHSQGFEIGAHTIHHPILNQCDDAQALTEIGGCREQLEAIIGGTVKLFAYPNGRPVKDFNYKHAEMVRACGYKGAVTTSEGAATCSSDLYQLPRFLPWGKNDARITYQIARNMYLREKQLSAYSRSNEKTPKPEVRCLLVASTFPPTHGGSAVVYENLCKHMPTGSVRVLTASRNYLTNREIEGWQHHDQSVGFPIDRVDLLRPLMMPAPANILISLYRLIFLDLALYARVFWAAARIVYRHRINVICIGELVTGTWLGLALRRIFGCKVIIYVHGEEVTTATGGRLHGNKRNYYLSAADKVVAVSSFTCNALTTQMGLRPEAIALIHNGVDTDRFTPGLRSKRIIEKFLLEDKKIVLSVGRLVARKGMDMAILAMSIVVRSRPDVHYLIVGEGEYRHELERLISNEGLANHVTLVGKVSEQELVDHFRTCDLFIMPNRTMPDGDTEGFGLVFREANACGKPVIGGRAGGAVEAVVDGVTGILVDGTDVTAIASAIHELLFEDGIAAKMGAEGIRLAQSNNTQAVSKQFITVCEQLLQARTGRQNEY